MKSSLTNLARTLAGLVGLAFALASPLSQAADKYPARTMEMMVPWGPSGGADTLGRLVARWIEADLKATMPVVNTPGAGGAIGLGKLVHAPADGHNLGVLTSDTVLLAMVEPQRLKLTDIMLLAVLTRQPSGFFVKADSPLKSWADVVAAAKADPGSISVATTGANSPDDLGVAHLDSKGIKMTSVAFAKPGERYAAVLGGHVNLLFEQAGDVKAYLDAKTMRPLLFFAAQRLPAPFADVPVSGEFGYDTLPSQVRAVVVKSDTDPAAVALLSASLDRFATSPGYTQYLRDQLAAPDSYVPTARTAALLAKDMDSLKRMLSALPPAAK
ncbi:MAG: hypothetical protein JWP52_1165 [Rhizobacter sp.]|nr:hypothetical protein [Rhizobacter sp.]